MLYSVDPGVFERFPGFRRVVVVAEGVDNTAESPELTALLRRYEEAARGEALQNFKQHPSLVAWMEVFTALGLNPNKFPPSVVNLVKRVRNGKALPYINSLVTIFNCVSLKYLVPCGGDDRSVMTGDLMLGPAKGTETYVPLGQPDVSEAPAPGEIIYYDTGNLDVFCRAWCWKNGDRSKLVSGTRGAVINVDAMSPVSLDHIRDAARELADLVRTHTGASVSLHELTPEKNQFEF